MMILLPFLIVAITVWKCTQAYGITEYWEESTGTSTRTRTIGSSSRLVTETISTRRVVTVTGTEVPSPITAFTTILGANEGRPFTSVYALISAGIGSAVPTATSSISTSPTQLYLKVTYSQCFSTGSDAKVTSLSPVTKFASVTLPSPIVGQFSSTVFNITTSVNPTTSYVVVQAYIDPSAVEPVDIAHASYRAQPTVGVKCGRATAAVDYRAICSASSPPILAVPTGSASCGELNPCCYGCQAESDGFNMGARTEYYSCEDGTERSLNGTILAAVSQAAAGFEIRTLIISLALAASIIVMVAL